MTTTQRRLGSGLLAAFVILSATTVLLTRWGWKAAFVAWALGGGLLRARDWMERE